MVNVYFYYFPFQAKAQDVCVKLTEDYESRLQSVWFDQHSLSATGKTVNTWNISGLRGGIYSR